MSASRSRLDDYEPAYGNSWRNTRTGEIVNRPPATVHHDGHYGGYDTPVYYYTDRHTGKQIATDSALDAQYEGGDPWAHG